MSAMPASSRLSRFRPTVETKFQIDYQWWEKSRQNFRLHLRAQLCAECQERFADHHNTEDVDWVDPETAEVHRTDALRECLRSRCASDPDYINERLTIVTACFRIFLANNNEALTPVELSNLTPWRSPEEILRTLGGRKVYLGLRPAR